MSKTGKPTRTVSVENVTSFVQAQASGYTVYTALLTQSGSLAPVATILQNTTGGTFVWTRSSGANYIVTASTALFTANKTIVFVNYGSAIANSFITWQRTSDTTITLMSGSDDQFTDASFEIRIY